VAGDLLLPYNLSLAHILSDSMRSTSLSLARPSLQALQDDLLGRARQPPQPDSVPLLIAGQRCGWLFLKAAQALAGLGGVELSPTEAHIGRLSTSEPALNALLARVSLTLRAAGCAPGWRHELLDVWVANASAQTLPGSQTSLGVIERGVVRPLGLLTLAVHLNGWSVDGKLWVARRALSKPTDPGMWDTLVGGLVSCQETAESALVRETEEEAGLEPQQIAHRTPLRTIARMHKQVPEGFQSEDVLTCECILPEGVTPKNRDGEVMDIQLFEPQTIFNMLKEGAFTLEASIVLVEGLLAKATARTSL
jgi:isopentenyldiphosphate isomerase